MKKLFNLIYMLLPALCLQAQTLSYADFMAAVAQNNIGYMAEKYNVDIATANLQAAKVFNDPELSVEYGNNQDWIMKMGQNVDVGLSFNPDLAGVRRARIAYADTELRITEASVAAYFSNLRLEAAEAWAEAWSLRKSCEIMEASVADIKQIAISDSIRFCVGDIGRADATQSRLEAQTLANALEAMKAEYANALLNLSYLCGGENVESLADEDLPYFIFPYQQEDLIELAEANRADLRAAELSHTLSQKNLKLVKASRAFELDLSVGYSYNTEVLNELAPAPMYHGLTVGVTIPLKFSSINKGEEKAARIGVAQSQRYYEEARLQVRTETARAYRSFLAADKVLSKYDMDMLQDARDIMESRKTGYLKGESSLVELLSAQQTYHDVMQSYIEAAVARYLCQAKLEQAIGTSRL